MATARHQWCRSKLVGTFGEDAAEAFFKNRNTAKKFTELFEGNAGNVMFVSRKADKTLAFSDGTDNLLEFQAVYFVRSGSGALNLEAVSTPL